MFWGVVVAPDNIIIVCVYCFLSLYTGNAIFAVPVVQGVINKFNIGAVVAIAFVFPFGGHTLHSPFPLDFPATLWAIAKFGIKAVPTLSASVACESVLVNLWSNGSGLADFVPYPV